MLCTNMVTRGRKKRRDAELVRIRERGQGTRWLYLTEWMEYRGIGDNELAGRLVLSDKPDGVSRETVTRWRYDQRRLDPEKIAALAAALDIEPWQLWQPPPATGQPTRQDLAEQASTALQSAAEAIKRMAGRGVGNARRTTL